MLYLGRCGKRFITADEKGYICLLTKYDIKNLISNNELISDPITEWDEIVSLFENEKSIDYVVDRCFTSILGRTNVISSIKNKTMLISDLKQMMICDITKRYHPI